MRQEVQQAYNKVTLENKEAMLDNILAGTAAKSARARKPRWGLIAANIAAAACLAIVAIVFFGTGRNNLVMPQTAGTSDPNSAIAAPNDNTDTQIADEGDWLYYPAGEMGLFRVKADGADFEKMDNAFDVSISQKDAVWHNVKEVTALGDWVYYSLTYFTPVEDEDSEPGSMAHDGHSGLFRMKVSGGARLVEVLAESYSELFPFRIWENEIYFYAAENFHKMQLDGTGKTKLLTEEEGEKFVGDTFVISDGWMYYATHSHAALDDGTLESHRVPAILRSRIDGTATELFAEPIADPKTQSMYPTLLSFAGDEDGIYYTTTTKSASGGLEMQLQRISIDSRETQVLFSGAEGSFTREWLVRGGWLYFSESSDMSGTGSLCKGIGTERILLAAGECWNIRLLGEKLYYTMYDEAAGQQGLYRINLDGSDKQTMGWLSNPTLAMPTPAPYALPTMDPLLEGDEPPSDFDPNMDDPFGSGLIDVQKVVDAGLARYKEKFGDKPMVMYYVDGVQFEYDVKNQRNCYLVDFWVAWGDNDLYCISVGVPGYAIHREYADTDSGTIAKLKTINFPVMKIFD